MQRIGIAALLVALTFAGTVHGARGLQLRDEVVAAAASVTGPDIRVRCAVTHGGLLEALGHADWTSRTIELARGICSRLNALVVSPATPSTAQAEAVLVLAHEAVHLSTYPGSRSEALTECRALQLVHDTALALGVDDDAARALGHDALRYDAQLPGPGNWLVGLHEIPSYRDPGCYDDGPLDIHPDSHDWPN